MKTKEQKKRKHREEKVCKNVQKPGEYESNQNHNKLGITIFYFSNDDGVGSRKRSSKKEKFPQQQ